MTERGNVDVALLGRRRQWRRAAGNLYSEGYRSEKRGVLATPVFRDYLVKTPLKSKAAFLIIQRSVSNFIIVREPI